MQYACLVYFDPRKVFDRSPEGEAVLRDCMDPANDLRLSGHVVTEAALDLPEQAMTLQVRNGNVSTSDGPFMETKEVLGGIVLIEARDLNEAMRIGAKIPLARIGSIEVRPLVDHSKPRPLL